MSRFRSVAAAISLVVVIAGCGAATVTPSAAAPSVAAPSVAAATPSSAPSASAAATPAGSPGTKFAGVNINILTFNGPQVAEPLQRRAPDWEQLTGGHVNVVAVGFQTIYDKALLDASTGTNSFDAYVFDPQWMGDFAGAGLPARPHGPRPERPAAPVERHRPVLPRLQRHVQRQGLHDPARRRLPHGLLPQRPAGQGRPQAAGDVGRLPHDRRRSTNGQDLNGDGQPDYGSCIAKKKGAQSYWWIISLAAGLLQGKGTGEGAFFDTTNMSPLFGKNDAMTLALQTYAKTAPFGPPDELNMDVGGHAACSRRGAAP